MCWKTLSQAEPIFLWFYDYYLIEQGAIEPGAHLNFLQFGSGTVTSADVLYNTTYQTPQASSGEGFQSYMNNSGTIIDASLANNNNDCYRRQRHGFYEPSWK